MSFFVARVSAQSEQSPSGHLLTIHDRGLDTVVLSEADTLEQALNEAGVVLDAKDAVEPARDEPLVASEYEVNIYRARPVTVIDGNTKQKVVTAYQTPAQIAASVGIELYPEDESEITRADDVLSDGAGLVLTIDRATEIKFSLYGKTITTRTQAERVGQMLAEKGISLGKNDGVSPSLATGISAGMTIKIWREGKQTVTVSEKVPFETEIVYDGDREVGYRAVKEKGVVGTRQVTYEIVVRKGKEVARKEIASVTTKRPSAQIEIVGAKNNYSSSLSEWLLALRTCETNGNYSANTGNGYYGAYQFSLETWQRVAPKVGRPALANMRPDQASPADQDYMVVQNAKISSGGLATQHPGCYQKLGLSQFPPE